METNTSKVFCVCMAILLLIVGISIYYDKSNNWEDFTLAAEQTAILASGVPNTDTMHNDSYCPVTITVNTESLLSYLPIICKTNSSKCWSMDLMTIYIIGLNLILKDQLHFFKRDRNSARFLPYFLVQLQIIHKSDGKYRWQWTNG